MSFVYISIYHENIYFACYNILNEIFYFFLSVN